MAYTIDARMRALEAASRCRSFREAERVTGISRETIRRWAIAGERGRLAGAYTGHVGYGKEVDVTGVDERLPKGDEAPESGFEGTPEEQIRQLRLENDILRGMVEVLKGADLGHLTNREKTVLIEWLRRETDRPLRELTGSLRISKSSYEYHRRRLGRDKYAALRARIVSLFEEGDGNWGYRTIWAHLRRDPESPVAVSEKVVRRIMAEEGLRVRYNKRKAKGWSSYEGEISKAPENLVRRNFHADAPDALWLTDITEFRLPDDSKVYLSPVVDCFDGKPVSWSIGLRPTSELANASLRGAIARMAPGAEPVVHSDRGGHYRWPEWVRICEEAGIVRSMSAKGCSPDNSAMEGFFGRLKNEFFYYRDWEGVSPEEFMERLDAYLEYYCEHRLKRSLGWMSPNEYRRSLGYAL